MPDDYVQEFYKHKSEGMAEAHPDGFYPAPIDCVVKLMKGFIARGVPVACATSGLREHVNEHMSHAGLLVCKTPAFFPSSSEKRSVCQDRLGTNTRNLNKRRGFRRSCAPTNGSWWRLTSRPAAGRRQDFVQTQRTCLSAQPVRLKVPLRKCNTPYVWHTLLRCASLLPLLYIV